MKTISFSSSCILGKKHILVSLCISSFSYSSFLLSISVIDASFKPNPGILTGNVNWMGNYRECMQTDGLHYCTTANVVLNIGQNVVSV